jgi:pSer/pThr/pTyr-binding forkhead associated (FHA) protein
MAKLVVLSEGMTGRSHELNVEKTTIGRVEDNTFQIPEPSVSSHHCEVLMRGEEIVVRDLNSTNGTFINGEKVSESVLKPGQTLRLGQIELRLDSGTGTTPTSGSASAPGPKKTFDQTVVMQRGVTLNELEQGPRTGTATKGFSKKDNKVNKIFLIVGIVIGIVIVGLLVFLSTTIRR